MSKEATESRRASRLLADVREVVERAGRETLSPAERRRIRDLGTIRPVLSSGISRFALLAPMRDDDGRQDLLLRRDTSPRQRLFLETYHSLRVRSRLRPECDGAAGAVAYYVVLNLKAACTEGASWNERVRRELGELAGPDEHQATAWSEGAARLALADLTSPTLRAPATARCAVAEAVRTQAIRARDEGRYDDAERLFTKAQRTAALSGDWFTVSMALIGKGRARHDRGSPPAARRLFVRALAVARAHGVGECVAKSLHEIFLFDMEHGYHRSAERLAKSTYEAYSNLSHPDLYRLAHDVARYWLLTGSAEAAVSVLRALLPVFQAREQLYVWGNIARACGLLADEDGVREAQLAVGKLRRHEGGEFVARSLVGCAYGLAFIGACEEARRDAAEALAIAVERGETRTAEEAGVVLRSARPSGLSVGSRAQRARVRFAEEIVGSVGRAA